MEGKTLAVNRTRMVEIQGRACVPTALYYCKQASHPYFGYEALQSASTPDLLNENFKIELGKINPENEVLNRKKLKCGDDQRRSAVNLVKDYFDCLIESVKAWMEIERYSNATHVLISEPLQFHADEVKNWLANYRKNVKRILANKFEQIEFMPEPFAVFQYYRYGLRHEYLTKEKKYRALVIDFGGGTFDTSIVETTKQGKISERGRHCQPKSAASVAVGGFHINQEIAGWILKQMFPKDAVDIKKGIENYHRWRNDDFDIEMLNEKNKSCVKAYRDLIHQTEAAKIQLCSQIRDWGIDSKLNQKVKLKVKENAFDYESAVVDLEFRADDFREIFVTEIWGRKLRRAVGDAFKRAEADSEGRGVNVVLISGGSANIKWLQELIKRDFSREVSAAHIASLQESYQDIVSKGLAIENVRRNYSVGVEQSTEFQDVTYNPIVLMLDADNKGVQIKPFKCISEDGLNPDNVPGVLVASAAQITDLVDQIVEWKVRLDSPPKQVLKYFFLRSVVDAAANEVEFLTEDRYNFVESKLFTKPGTKFDSKLRVQVRFCQDGTCHPVFIYKTEANEATEFVAGVPFYIDAIISESNPTKGAAYLGLDFGSSNTSISYVTDSDVEELDEAPKEMEWLGLNELAGALPDMAASSLREFMAARGADASWVGKCIGAIENLLCLVAYLLAAESQGDDPKERSGALREYISSGKRSMGPLRGLIRGVLTSKNAKGRLESTLREVSKDDWAIIDSVIDKLNDAKHHKLASEVIVADNEIRSAICKLGNLLQKLLHGQHIGFFEGVRKQGFSNKYSGVFRIADNAAPYYQTLDYVGQSSFSEEAVYLIDSSKGTALCLSPLLIWVAGSSYRGEAPQCYAFDSMARDGGCSFKSMCSSASQVFTQTEAADLVEAIEMVRIGKAAFEVQGNLSFTGLLTD